AQGIGQPHAHGHSTPQSARMPILVFLYQCSFAWAVVQSVFSGYLVARSLPAGIFCAKRLGDARALCSATLQMLKSMLVLPEKDPLDQKVRHMIVRSRLETFTALLPIALVLNSALLLHDLVRNRRWPVLAGFFSEACIEVGATQLSCILVLLFRQGLNALFLAKPRLVNPLCIRVGISLVYLRLIVEASTLQEADIPVWLASTAPMRLGASIMLGEISTATCLNVLLSTAICCCYAGDWHVSFHLYLCGVVWGVMYVIDRVRYAQFRAVLEARMSHRVVVAADGLLSRLCDAVVHLGEDFRITKPSPHLATMLHRPSSCGGMGGVLFLDLFQCSEERERVQAFLLRNTPGADALHTSIKDSNDVVVTVQLFHICGRDFDDSFFHVVGVREDEESFRMPPEAPPSHAAPVVAPPGESLAADVESVSTVQLESDSGDLAVYFQLFEAGCPVEKCSAGFTALTGPSAPGARLLEWMVSADSFVQCVQELRDSALRERQGLPLRRSVRVQLRPPHLRSLGMELRAAAVLSLRHNDADAEVQLWTAKVELANATVVRRRARRERAPPQPRAAPALAACQPDPERSCAGAQATPGPPAGQRQEPPGAALALAQAAPPPGAPSQPSALRRAGRSSRSSLSSSSGSSGSSRSSAQDRGRVSSIYMRLNFGSRSLRIYDFMLRFEDGRLAPCLKDWLPRESLTGIHTRCQ
ncbi:unnamed protein product, partial [Prorocentrum cordatum]